MTEGMTSNPNVETALEGSSEYLDIYGGALGFTYTIDQALAGVLQHGLLSRQEERKRGLHVRVRESRSLPDTIYFTTRANDVYVRTSLDAPKTIDELMANVVGIAIDRPDYAKTEEGHFGVQDYVDPNKLKALVFIDEHATPTGVSAYGKPAFRFGKKLPADKIDARVRVLREACEVVGKNTPVYGISGDKYWPPETGQK